MRLIYVDLCMICQLTNLHRFKNTCAKLTILPLNYFIIFYTCMYMNNLCLDKFACIYADLLIEQVVIDL